MVKLTKEDENKLGQILKELNEMRNVLKGGEGSGKKGHKTSSEDRKIRSDQENTRAMYSFVRRLKPV